MLSSNRYFVTELLGTDLHRLLTSRPLEKQFIQYFLYQILVSLADTGRKRRLTFDSAASNMSTRLVSFIETSNLATFLSMRIVI